MKNKSQNGYAILFTVVIIGIISLIAVGLSNATYKQLVLSSTARDSHTAFYQADMGTECAIYADVNNLLTPGGTFKCGVDKDGNDNNFIVGADGSVLPDTPDSPNPCFNFTLTKTSVTDQNSHVTTTHTKVLSKGYNICDSTNARTVEREIDVNY